VRRRITLLVAATTTLVVIAFAVPLAVLIRHNVYSDAVRSLQNEAGRIGLYLRGGATTPTSAQISAYLANLGSSRAVSVQLPDGTVLGTAPPGGSSPVAGAGGLNDHGHAGRGSGPGGGDDHGGPPPTTTSSDNGGQLAQLQVPDPSGGSYTIRVYASDAQLHSGETSWWLLLAGASLGLLVIGVTAAELLTRRIVRPLTETAHTARALAAGDTAARAPTDGPREIAEVGASINRLADRIDELIAEERETAADLSHRMRTPLTALRLDAESLHDPAEADRIGSLVGELERTLTAVIHAARRPQREGRMPSCDPSAVVGDRVAFWSALAEDQERRGTISLPSEPLPVRASAEDLATATDALLENIVAHTPEGTPFEVRLSAVPGGARLEVSDDGPGLPSAEPIRGRSDRGSSGLGLDIARRCAEAAGGSMTLGATPSGGALITLELRAP
jgi:signal transduction histidine kinase